MRISGDIRPATCSPTANRPKNYRNRPRASALPGNRYSHKPLLSPRYLQKRHPLCRDCPIFRWPIPGWRPHRWLCVGTLTRLKKRHWNCLSRCSCNCFFYHCIFYLYICCHKNYLGLKVSQPVKL